MAGSITVSSITLDSDNTFRILSNTGATLVSANGSGIISGIANGASIVSAQLTTPTVSGNLSLDSTGTSGIRLPAANTLAFHTAGSEDMRIDATGNVGIGVTATTQKLYVNGSACFPNDSKLGFHGNPSAATISNYYSGSDTSNYLTMFAGGTERVRIDSSGNVLVGTTSSYGNVTVDIGSGQFTTDEKNGTLTVKSDVGGRPLIMVRTTSSGQDTAFRVSANRSGTQDAWTIGCHIARNSDNLSINYGTTNTAVGTERFYFTSAGAAYNTTGTWGTISDARFKENIVDATPKLDKINQLKVRNFNLIDDDLKQIGLIAQEVEEIFPSLVETNELKDGKEQKTVKMSVFVPILIKAIQEQQAMIEELKAEVEALKAK